MRIHKRLDVAYLAAFFLGDFEIIKKITYLYSIYYVVFPFVSSVDLVSSSGLCTFDSDLLNETFRLGDVFS